MKKFDHTTPDTQDIHTMGFRRIILVDFDGVLHLATSGWKGHHVIMDGPVEGAIAWLRSVIEAKNAEGEAIFDVQIYSSRSRYANGIVAMRMFLEQHGVPHELMEQVAFPVTKSPAWLTIDDRCFRFEGTFPTLAWMERFESWTKQMPQAGGDAEFLRGLANLERNEDGEGVELDAEQCRRLHGIADWLEGIYRTRPQEA